MRFNSQQGEFADVLVHEVDEFPKTSVFSSIEEASEDFRKDKVGYSPNKNNDGYKGVKLNTTNWDVSPLGVQSAGSSLFSDNKIFPEGSNEIDHSLLMKNIEHNWQDVENICCS